MIRRALGPPGPGPRGPSPPAKLAAASYGHMAMRSCKMVKPPPRVPLIGRYPSEKTKDLIDIIRNLIATFNNRDDTSNYQAVWLRLGPAEAFFAGQGGPRALGPLRGPRPRGA